MVNKNGERREGEGSDTAADDCVMRGNHGQRNKNEQGPTTRTTAHPTGDPVRGLVGQPFIRKPLTIRDNYSPDDENSKSLRPSFRRAEKMEELMGAKREPPAPAAGWPNSRLLTPSFKLPHKNYGFIATTAARSGGR